MAISPMMQQYLKTKEEYSDCILFYRLGDFYEMFFEDAKLVSRILELTLTGKSCGLEEKAPMCGVPHHSADIYIERLVSMGYKVAICEQLEDPKETKGMVKRGVVKIVTPGTVTSDKMLKGNENNYLGSVFFSNKGFAISYCDISTGEFFVTEKNTGSHLFDDLIDELVKISAKEILVNEDFIIAHTKEEFEELTKSFVQIMPQTYYTKIGSETVIKSHFKNLSMTALGLDGRELAKLSVGALLSYLIETQKQSLLQLTQCNYYEIGNHMALDRATIRNLELTETLYDKSVKGSLLWVLDKTVTAMGGRKLKQWIREPLNHTEEINLRLDAVDNLVNDPILHNDLIDSLKNIYDFQRLAGRIASGNANGKDIIALKNSIKFLPEIKSRLKDASSSYLKEISSNIDEFEEIYAMIDDSMVDNPPYTITDGGLIKSGFSKELDDLKNGIKDAKDWIVNLEASEKKRTGITHLKVGYNKIFGYYIEISRSNLDMVPEEYIRKQTLVGGERFITSDLKEKEAIVLNAETKINKLEYEIFVNLREKIKSYTKELQETSILIAETDVLCSFATVSSRSGYTKPIVDNSYIISIERGRHPVIEKTIENGMFVPNDSYLDNYNTSTLIITGPNMAGKSTYMRQCGLIVLMAQIGCFVPADKAQIGICDRIFTRIGASDNLAAGQSTFFVEMSELAYILRNASERSLIILDEIGRGTSTYDGLSIAWAAVEYLCNEHRKIRTLFATHYHEMTILEDDLRGVKNLNVDVAEENGNIVFLHKIIPGSANQSYGIHVAKIAGVPKVLLINAEDKLRNLENTSKQENVRDSFRFENKKSEPIQLSLFDDKSTPIIDELKKIDLMDVTPSEAIRILEDLKDLIEK